MNNKPTLSLMECYTNDIEIGKEKIEDFSIEEYNKLIDYRVKELIKFFNEKFETSSIKKDIDFESLKLTIIENMNYINSPINPRGILN